MKLDELKARLIGRTITDVGLGTMLEYNAIVISTITLDDGTTFHLSGEHEVAYLELAMKGDELDESVDLDPSNYEESEEEEEAYEEEEPVDTRPTLSEVAPDWVAENLSNSKGGMLGPSPEWLGWRYMHELPEWPIKRMEAKYCKRVLKFERPDGLQRLLGIFELPWKGGKLTAMFAASTPTLDWFPMFGSDIEEP